MANSMRNRIIAAMGLAAITSGCVSQNANKLVTALAKDPSAISAESTLSTPWGSHILKITRVGSNTNTISITASNADVNKK